MMAALDHLVVAARTLDEGAAHVEACIGLRPAPGGKHARMGTHNMLLGLGPDAYLEVIAIDPDAPAPDGPRWFGLSDPATLADGPRLVTWVARTDDLDALAAVPDLGTVTPFARDALRWRFAVPAGGALLQGGAVPPMIAWQTPPPAFPESGARLVALEAAVPAPEAAAFALAARGLTGLIALRPGPGRLQARIATAGGERILR